MDLRELLKPGAPHVPSVIGREKTAGAGGAGIGEPTAGELVPSNRLREHPEAMEYFDFYKRTTGFGHLKQVDQPLLEMLCIYLATFDRVLDEYLTQPKLVQLAVSGMQNANPYFQYMLKIGETIRKLCSELAFTPIERARLKNVTSGSPEEMAKEAQRREMHARYLASQTVGDE